MTNCYPITSNGKTERHFQIQLSLDVVTFDVPSKPLDGKKGIYNSYQMKNLFLPTK